ncbi:MAG: FAD-dependent oxidoreductase [Eubacterium sp.]|nr:FAD-dependent oxidoreductase [Eubacterium sp.]
MEKTKYTHLFAPLSVGKLKLKNRIAYAPVGTGISENGTSAFDDADIDFFVARAKGGPGLIFTGAVQTDLEIDKYTPGSLGAWNIAYNPSLFKLMSGRMLDRVHSYGARMFIQLTMGVGRNSGMKAPSPIPVFADPSKESPVLTTEELQKKIQYMIDGAVIAKQCGFDGVEVHAMHFGYLLDELAMSISNQRTDQYGGSFENRMRAAKEIIDGIKAKCGADYPVSMRLGMKSYIRGFNQSDLTGEEEAGRTLEEAVQISKYLEEIGYDLLSVDVGIYDSYYYCYPPMYLEKGINVNLAAVIKESVDIPVIVCGRMNEPELCEDTLAAGKADGVVIGRAMLADPDFAKKAKLNQAEAIRPCLSCNIGCRRKMQSGLGLSCVVNPLLRKEGSVYSCLLPAETAKDIMVIGAGAAGMEAARAAAARGHRVTVYEKASAPGGMTRIAGKPDFKDEDERLIQWYVNQLKALGVEIICNQEVDLDFVVSKSPDAVISACGAVPIVPGIEGKDHEKTVVFEDALLGKKQVGKKVVVVGGGLVGCETALHFAKKHRDVTIVEALDDILSSGAPTPPMNKLCLEDLFKQYHVEIRTASSVELINDDGAVIHTAGGQETIEADTVIMAVGLKSRAGFTEALEAYNIEAYSIGDEYRVSNMLQAIAGGYEIGRSI